jgi:biotin transport system ATP-binding protein
VAAPGAADAAIRLDGVTVAVAVDPEGAAGSGTKVLLDDVTVTLAERRIAVIGPNGSGKSTFLRLLNGLVRPTAGTVSVAGFDTARSVAEVRRRVGFVFTDPMAQLLMPTAAEDIELSLRRVGLERRARRARALALLEEWGLARIALSSVYDLSGGERQLVALISVLASGPSVVVADEPTTLLDLRNSVRLRAAFAGLEQQVIVATHDLEWALGFDRVLVIQDGRVAFDGAAADGVAWYRGSVGQGGVWERGEILRCAQDDRRRGQGDRGGEL